MARLSALFLVFGFCFFCLVGTITTAQTRIISHVTASGGGFSTAVLIENLSELENTYSILPYDKDGNTLAVVSGSIAGLETIESTVAELFGSSHSISHFVVSEDSGDIVVRVAYAVASGRGSPAHLTESAEQRPQWRLFAGEWDTVFDGIAVVNMGSSATDVTVRQISSSGTELHAEVVLHDLAPMAKGLYVIGGPAGSEFQAISNAYFQVSAAQDLAITALRGTPPGAPVGYLWENEVDKHSDVDVGKRFVSHVTRQGGGFSSTILGENRSDSPKAVLLQPYAQDGSALTPLNISLQGYETAAWSLETLFGSDATAVSHFEITGENEFVSFSVSYRIASGPGSPAQLRESNVQKFAWRFYPGNWDEVFDGFAVVNTGALPADVAIQQISLNGDVLQSELAIKNLAPMAKGLYVIGGPQGSIFSTRQEGTYFELVASEPIAVTLLRGTPPGAPTGYLWKNGTIFFDDLRKADGGLADASLSIGGSVQGYIYDSNGLIVVDDPSNAPAGATAISNAQVKIFDTDETLLEQSSTHTDGFFSFENIPRGIHFLDVDRNGAKTAELRHPFSCLHWETLKLGKPYGITRQAAIDAVSGMVTEVDLALCTMNPLPAGTHLRPFGDYSDVRNAEHVWVIDTPTWFLMVDHNPFQRYGHPVSYFLVDAETGALTQIEGIYWFPLVNHFPYWSGVTDYTQYEEIEPPEDEDTVEAEWSPLDEVFQFPQTDTLLQFEDSPYLNTSKTAGAGDVFVLIIRGDDGPLMKSDSRRFTNFLIKNNVPHEQEDPNIKVMHTSLYDTPAAAKKALAKQISDINKEIEKRLNEDPKRYSTFLIYINSHGGPEVKPSPGRKTGWFSIKAKNGKHVLMGAKELTNMTIKGTKACKVRFIVDICFAAWFSEDLFEIFIETEHDFISYHAAGRFKKAASNWDKVDIGGEKERVTFKGGKFITNLLKNAKLENGDFVGPLVEGDGGEFNLVDDVANLDQEPGWFPGSDDYEPKNPPWCQDSTSGVSFTPDPMTAPLNKGDMCAMSNDFIGFYHVYNPYPYDIVIQGQGDNPDVVISLGSSELAPGDWTWIDFNYNGDSVIGDIDLDFWVHSEDTQGGNPTTTTAETKIQPGPDMMSLLMFYSISLALNPSSVLWWNHVNLFVQMTSRLALSIFMYLSNGNQSIFTGCTMGSQQVTAISLVLTAVMLNRLFAMGMPQKAIEDPIYPCGQGPNGLTICAESPLEGEEGDYIVISNVLQESIDIADSENYFQFGFVFESDGNPNNNYQPSSSYPMDFYKDTDLWYSAEYSPSLGWKLKVTDARSSEKMIASAARVIIKDHVIMLVVPKSEFSTPNPTYRITSFRHTGDYGLTSEDWDGYMYPLLDEPLAPVGEFIE